MESTEPLLAALVRTELLTPEQGKQLASEGLGGAELVSHLVQRGWVTPFQGQRLLEGKPEDLLLGTYCLLEPLGKGGMGEVYKARHRVMNRFVAVKVIRPDLLDRPELVRRFRREVQALAQLNHPNIVTAHDADQAGGVYFVVMEYCEGVTLDRLVRAKGPLPVAPACGHARQAALGLAHAHEKGLVHRDIKPANLLLTGGTIKILDLGLAAFRTAEGLPATGAMTHSGVVMGTPDYLAPEQARDARSADFRADLYSLGCTLYHLLTGQVPFPGGALTEKLIRHQLEEPAAPESLRPDIPEPVAAVVRRLMAKDPAARYASAAEAARALAPFARAEGVHRGEGSKAGELVPPGSSPRQTPPAPSQRGLMETTDEESPPTRPGSIVPPRAPPSAESRRVAGAVPCAEVPAAERAGRRGRRGRAALVVAGLVLLALFALALALALRGRPDGGKPGPIPRAPAAAAPDAWVPWQVVPIEGAARVQSLAFCPSSRLLALGTSDVPGESPVPPTGGKLVLWDVNARRQCWERRHSSTVFALAFTESGDRIVSAVGDRHDCSGEMKVWQVEEGAEQFALAGHKGGTMALIALPGTSLVVSGGKDGRLRLWRTDRAAKPEQDIDAGHTGGVSALAASAEGTWVATGGRDSAIILRDAGLKKLDEWREARPGDAVGSLAFSPSWPLLVGTCGMEARLWDVRSGGKRRHPEPLEDYYQVRFSPDGRRVVTTHPSNPLDYYEADPRPLALRKLAWGPKETFFVDFSRDGKLLATAGEDGNGKLLVQIWRPAGRE